MAQPTGALTVCDAWDGRVAMLTVHGEIDVTTAGVLRESLGHVIRKDPEQLIIDLAQVPFLDCAAVHAFSHARHMLPTDCQVILRAPQRQARRIFEITALGSLCVVE